eukprot:scaffold237531_cov76-Cyclotella_meneghiniana.AAC.3
MGRVRVIFLSRPTRTLKFLACLHGLYRLPSPIPCHHRSSHIVCGVGVWSCVVPRSVPPWGFLGVQTSDLAGFSPKRGAWGNRNPTLA